MTEKRATKTQRLRKFSKDHCIILRILIGVVFYILLGLTLWWFISPLTITQRKDFAVLMAQIAAGGALLLGLYFTWRRVEVSQQTLATQQDQQVTERFTRAIDQLGAAYEAGGPKLEIRIGGIYALERIARESLAADYSTVIEVLIAYIQEHTKLTEPAEQMMREVHTSEGMALPRRDVIREEPETVPLLRADIQAALNVLGRRSEDRVPQQFHVLIDLRNCDLSGADLSGAYLSGAYLSGANLTRATLSGANLYRANLGGAKLFGAYLGSANLSKAEIWGANLSRAIVADANLSEAELWRSDLRGVYMPRAELSGASLYETNLGDLKVYIKDGSSSYLTRTGTVLSGANLTGANFGGANLSGAELDSTNFREANLSGADFTEALLASQEQIEQAIGDTTTKLPVGISIPASWSVRERLKED